ncbi:hypothetical protein P256_00238 [Acinetobacter nectaris CIP 110549]|uniref:Uncharacterized protein n=1 Tax=Acinetobacter nectaris CIP 110549 TaxID=1392540 RepID=V2V143_9GAMM|nr:MULTISPECIES: hypothetical protein [Acinetobacter]ESK41249.1 hypothetical protein P256_00238 [Acinetobacter nectaris CIP 110549]WEV48120.1 hypothetical protein OZX61_07425 [Acinetobacter sp. ESL0695]
MIILKEGYEAFDKFLKTTLSQVVLSGTCLLFLYKATTMGFTVQASTVFISAILSIFIAIFWIIGNIQNFWNSFFNVCLSERVDCVSYNSNGEKFFDIKDIRKIWKVSKRLVLEIIFVIITIYFMLVILFFQIFIYINQMSIALHI